MRLKTAALSLSVGLVSVGVALAHEGKVHVMGTVKVVEAKRLDIETKEGKTVSVALTEKTQFVKDKVAAEAKDVQVGTRVVADVEGEADKLTATKVTIGKPKTSSSEADADEPAAEKPVEKGPRGA